MTDDRVSALNAAIEAHLEAGVVAAGSTEDAHSQAEEAREVLSRHQPTRGEWGRPCLSHYSRPDEPWPCLTVLRIEVTTITAEGHWRYGNTRGECGSGRGASAVKKGFRGRPAQR